MIEILCSLDFSLTRSPPVKMEMGTPLLAAHQRATKFRLNIGAWLHSGGYYWASDFRALSYMRLGLF